MTDWMSQYLVCPRDKHDLIQQDGRLCCREGHSYPIRDGVPVMLLDEVDPTMELLEHSLRLGNSEDPPDSFFLDTLGISDLEKQGILELAANPVSQVDPVVSFMVGATNGIAYESVIGRLREYPIPHLRLPPGESRTFLDLG